MRAQHTTAAARPDAKGTKEDSRGGTDAGTDTSTNAGPGAGSSSGTPQGGPRRGPRRVEDQRGESRSRAPPPPLPPLTDLSSPASWYPLARKMRRKVVAHLGPTNSGKTHAALMALKAAPSGIYCGPLRLLACEVADRLAAEGLPCHLLTGQEVRAAAWPGGRPATHTACTIEMADVTRGSGLAVGGGGGAGAPLDVAVLDEIQMLGDTGRGWAWTRALLGLAAREVHVAGDPAVLPLLRELVAQCGDELEVRQYRRLSPLVVQAAALGGLGEVAAGDCLVAFSRRSLHGLRREVVRRTNKEACLVYGALPPEARRQQAALFNAQNNPYESSGPGGASAPTGSAEQDSGPASQADGGPAALGRRPHAPHPSRMTSQGQSDSSRASSSAGHDDVGPDGDDELDSDSGAAQSVCAGARVLCASDAIGMGLNLNIRRVVFTSLHKFDGRSVRPLQASEVRQIAGRAGRFSSAHPTGYATTLHPEDLPALHAALAQPPQPVTRACLLPSSELLAAYAGAHPDRPLATSLVAFAAEATLGPSYVYGTYEGMYRIASALRHLGDQLSAEELLLFSTAPADMDDPAVAAALLRFAERYCEAGRVEAGDIEPDSGGVPQEAPRSETELKRLEELHRCFELYMWLSFRMPHAFTGRQVAEAGRAACGALIEEGLERLATASAAAFGRRPHRRPPQPHRAAARAGAAWTEDTAAEEQEDGEARMGGGPAMR